MHIDGVSCAAISAAAATQQQTEIAIGFIVIDQYISDDQLINTSRVTA